MIKVIGPYEVILILSFGFKIRINILVQRTLKLTTQRVKEVIFCVYYGRDGRVFQHYYYYFLYPIKYTFKKLFLVYVLNKVLIKSITHIWSLDRPYPVLRYFKVKHKVLSLDRPGPLDISLLLTFDTGHEWTLFHE